MWKTLRHPNVLSLIGVTMTEIQFAMISEWMVNGNINDFVRTHPNEDRFKLVSFPPEFLSSPDYLPSCNSPAGRRC